MLSNFAQAVDAELQTVYSDALRATLSQSTVFDRFWTLAEHPVLGPPAPPWYEVQLDMILSEGGDVRPALLALLDEADDRGRDW